MLEIEAKYPLQDATALTDRLQEWGAIFIEERVDADHYFNALDRDFAQTDEAFRVRRIGSRNYLTYKGPKLDTSTKSRQEIEVPVADGDKAADDLLLLIGKLGYRPVALVRKQRTVYELERYGFTLQFCIDRPEGLSAFAEIEIMAEQADFERAREILQKVAAELGFATSERRSYLQMLLAKNSEA